MKKKHIRLLVVVMAFALIGLLAIQWNWVKNAVNLREAQFERNVKEALFMVSERLQDRELAMVFGIGNTNDFKKCMTDDGWPKPLPTGNRKPRHPLENKEKPLLQNHKSQAVSNTKIQRRITTIRDGQKTEEIEELTIDTGFTLLPADSTFAQELEASLNYFQNFMERMVSCTKPLNERVRRGLLDTLLRLEFQRRDIHDKYVYNLKNARITYALDTASPEKLVAIDPNLPVYRVALFPHDILPGEHYIELQFPNRGNSTLRAMGLLLPTSGVLVMVILLCFGIAVFAWQRQQKLSALKTDFINNMTHELKTPISTISLALEALGDPDMQSPDRIGMYTKMIQQENDRLKVQVERVLQAAAFERGELKLSLEKVDLNELVCIEIERIRIHIESRGGTITYHNSASNSHLLADKIHLSGIIFNLLDNANKYSENLPKVEVTLENLGQSLKLTVKDNGIGMQKDVLNRIFEKFYRVPTGDVHNVKGFGLGLSYVKSIVEAHGGAVKVQSELKQGTVFQLYLPQKSSKI